MFRVPTVPLIATSNIRMGLLTSTDRENKCNVPIAKQTLRQVLRRTL